MKILYLLFAVFFLMLQISAGYSQFINNPAACYRARGSCRRFCIGSIVIGTCGQAQNCCRRRRW